MKFSALNRSAYLEKLKTETFDLLVIGGGATGCGIALDAASRGLKTALVEKEDYASGTSSKSTKLIHGGLRYLKQLDFALVRETGTERAIVHKLAPHLVLPKKMLMPLVKNGTYGYWSTSFGLWVYDVLAGVEGDDRRKMLSKEKTLKLEPLLDPDGLKGGGFYAEYRTDDARLTIELIKTATKFGATALNYCKVSDFVYDGDQITAANCHDELSGETFAVKAKKIVSAGGPWVDKLRKKDGSLSGKRLHLTKGVHIVFPHDKIPIKYTSYFDGPDGRMIFAVPRGTITYVGTTDTTYKGSLDRVVATKADAEYLIKAVKYAFPTIEVGMSDIMSNWAGLRPLIHEDGKSPSELSRKDEIFISDTGLISIAGGKLTGYRKMGQRIVDLVVEELDDNLKLSPNFRRECQTKTLPLTEEIFKDWKAVLDYISSLEKQVVEIGLPAHRAGYLVHNYGKQTEAILEEMKDFDDAPEIALARAEAWFGVNFEQVQSAEDFFVRRTGRLFFDTNSISKIRGAVIGDLQSYLKWNKKMIASENQRLDDLIYDATNYYEKELEAETV